MFCTKCGAQNADGVGFCSNCGSPLQPSQAGNGSQAGAQEKKIEIKSPACGRTGLLLAIISVICAGISLGCGFLLAPLGLLTSAAAIILAIPAIVLGRKALKELNSKYRDIAMQNIVYRDEFNSAKNNMTSTVVIGIMAIVFGVFGLLISRAMMSVFW